MSTHKPGVGAPLRLLPFNSSFFIQTHDGSGGTWSALRAIFAWQTLWGGNTQTIHHPGSNSRSSGLAPDNPGYSRFSLGVLGARLCLQLQIDQEPPEASTHQVLKTEPSHQELYVFRQNISSQKASEQKRGMNQVTCAPCCPGSPFWPRSPGLP